MDIKKQYHLVCKVAAEKHKKLYRSFLAVLEFDSDKTSKGLFKLLLTSAYAMLLVLLLNLTSLFSDGASYGTFGDFFGGVLNPILTFLTFMGLLFTILLQQSELKLTRKELKDSAAALSDQAKTLAQQLSLAQNKERRDLTIKMLDRWTSKDMREHRLVASKLLNEEYKAKGDAYSLNLTDLRYYHSDALGHFNEVCHFFSDLNMLLSEHALDKELSVTLFKSSVVPWFKLFKGLRYCPEGSDLYEPEDKEIYDWYIRQVIPLKDWF